MEQSDSLVHDGGEAAARVRRTVSLQRASPDFAEFVVTHLTDPSYRFLFASPGGAAAEPRDLYVRTLAAAGRGASPTAAAALPPRWAAVLPAAGERNAFFPPPAAPLRLFRGQSLFSPLTAGRRRSRALMEEEEGEEGSTGDARGPPLGRRHLRRLLLRGVRPADGRGGGSGSGGCSTSAGDGLLLPPPLLPPGGARWLTHFLDAVCAAVERPGEERLAAAVLGTLRARPPLTEVLVAALCGTATALLRAASVRSSQLSGARTAPAVTADAAGDLPSFGTEHSRYEAGCINENSTNHTSDSANQCWDTAAGVVYLIAKVMEHHYAPAAAARERSLSNRRDAASGLGLSGIHTIGSGAAEIAAGGVLEYYYRAVFERHVSRLLTAAAAVVARRPHPSPADLRALPVFEMLRRLVRVWREEGVILPESQAELAGDAASPLTRAALALERVLAPADTLD